MLCCALTLAFIPTATARRDHRPPAATAPPPAAPAPSSSAGSSAGTSTTGASNNTAASTATSTSAPTTTSTTPPNTATTTAGVRPAPATGATPPADGAGTHRPGERREVARTNTERRRELARAREAAREQANAGERGAEAHATTPAQTAAAQLSAARTPGAHRKEGSKEPKRTHQAGHGKGRSGKGAGGSGSSDETNGGSSGETGTRGAGAGAQPSTPTGAATVLAPAPPLGAATTTPAASAVAPAQLTPQLALGAAAPPVRRRAGDRSRRPPRHSSRVGAQLGADAAAFAGAGLAAPAAAAGVATAARTPPSAREGAPKPKPDGPASPLVRTITKIVDVVPGAVRELIAALLALALALAVRSRVVALRARRLERQRSQLLEDVGLLQAALLPVAPARLGPVGTSAAYQPAAGPGAGGDFYDMFALDDGQLAVIVGDVSGHGRAALPHTALVRFTLRAYLEAGLSPRDAVQTAGAVLERQLGGAFATVLVATYNPRERQLCYASAGHPPPLVIAAHGDARSLPAVTICAAPPIAVGMRTGTRQTVVSIPGRAHVCLHTDGVTDARVGAELFGAQRLARTLAQLGPTATAAELLQRVAELAHERPDDMAACLLRIDGGEDAPRVLVEELELDRDDASSERTERFLLACGLERDEAAELMRSARVAAGRARTVVIEVRHTGGGPEVALRRERLAYIHARRAHAGVAL